MKGTLEFAQIIISGILCLGSLCMLIHAMIVESPIKAVSIVIFGIMFICCICMLKTTYKEYKAEN